MCVREREEKGVEGEREKGGGERVMVSCVSCQNILKSKLTLSEDQVL